MQIHLRMRALLQPVVVHTSVHCRVVSCFSLLLTQWRNGSLTLEDADVVEFHTRRLVDRYGELTSLVMCREAPPLGAYAHFRAAARRRVRLYGQEMLCEAHVVCGTDPEVYGQEVLALHERVGSKVPTQCFPSLNRACRWISRQAGQHPALRSSATLVRALAPLGRRLPAEWGSEAAA